MIQGPLGGPPPAPDFRADGIWKVGRDHGMPWTRQHGVHAPRVRLPASLPRFFRIAADQLACQRHPQDSELIADGGHDIRSASDAIAGT